MYLVGIDIGFGDVKICAQKQELLGSTDIIKKYFKNAIYPKYDERSTDPLQSLGLVDKKTITLEDGMSYYIDYPMALDLRDRSFPETKEWLATCLYSIGILDEQNNITVVLATGLPVGYHSKRAENEIKKKLEKVHKVKINNKVKNIKIEDVSIFSQAYGAFYNYLISVNDKKVEINKEILEQQVVIIDIGFFTTDIVVFKKGESIKEVTFPFGISFMYDMLRDDLIKKTDLTLIDIRDIEEIFLKGYMVYENEKIAIDKSIYIERLKEKIKASVITVGLKDLVKKSDITIMTGGGSKILFGKGDRFDNAMGYLKILMVEKLKEEQKSVGVE